MLVGELLSYCLKVLVGLEVLLVSIKMVGDRVGGYFCSWLILCFLLVFRQQSIERKCVFMFDVCIDQVWDQSVMVIIGP